MTLGEVILDLAITYVAVCALLFVAAAGYLVVRCALWRRP